MTFKTTDPDQKTNFAAEQTPSLGDSRETPEATGSLNEISIIKFKMNKFKLAVMMAAKLTKNYTDGYLNAQREVMLTGLSLYGRLYDIGYVDRDRYTKDILDLVNTYEKHLKEAPIIASIRQIRSTGRTPGVNISLTAEERSRYIGQFSVADTMNRVVAEAQAEVSRPSLGGYGSAGSDQETSTSVQAIRAKPLIETTQLASPVIGSDRKSPSSRTSSARVSRAASPRARKTVFNKISGWLK